MLDLTGYKLTFADEFNARSISQTGAGTTWADIRSEWRFDANSDIGFGHSSFVDSASGYDPFKVQGGALTITAVPDKTTSGYPGSWESGLITTQGNFSQTYGYFEMRADLASAKGGWDAFWMLPNKAAANPTKAPGWQELDIVEHYGANEGGVYSALHTTDNTPSQNLQYYSSHPGLTSGYHTYGVNWQADKISFYFDGKYMGYQLTPSDMHGPMYMLANLATQNDADEAGVPMSMKIDYIRAYSADPNAVAVTQGTVSAPDGQDPGLYGATSATSAKLIAPLTIGTSGDDTISIGTDVPADAASTATVYGGLGNDLITMKGLKAAFNVIGGEGSDTITVQNTGATFITGGNLVGVDQTLDGADSITVNGSGGTIAIFSNLGNDTVSATGLQDATTIQIYGGKGNDLLSAANLTTTGKNSIFIGGGEDADTILATGNGGALTIFGGISSADPTDGADNITIGNGSTGTLNVFANAGNDTVSIGTLGTDATTTAIVYGGSGADAINVASQTATSQTLVLNGNEGADTFSIAKGAGQTITIADFSVGGADKLSLTQLGNSPGTLQVNTGSYQSLQQALDAAANSANGTANASKAAAVVFAGSAYVVIDNTAGAGFQATDQAIKLTGVTDLAGLSAATTLAA